MGQKMGACTAFKNTYSVLLLLFSISMILGLIFTRQTKLSVDVHPALAFVVFWAALIWLNMVEGSQGSLVGLPPVNRELYRETHPITYKITGLAHKGDNLDRYLMGRQFMVIFIVFIINMAGAPLPGSDLWGFPGWLQNIMLTTGIAMILTATMFGQLNSQVNASHCMLDYINNHFATFTVYVTMILEFTGMMHSCYLIQMIFGWLAGKPIESNEPPKDGGQALFFWARVILSLAVLAFAFAVTLEALFQGKTTMWDGVPPIVSVILFFVLMSVVGMLEGMQIAFFAVSKLPKDERGEAKCAKMTANTLFRDGGRNLPGFMIGRQICVTLCFFVIARVTSLNVDVSAGDETIFGVSESVQEFFNTGLLGAIITTIVGSISWQLVASAFPIGFLANPVTYILLRWCLFLEATGICSGAWVLAWIHKKVAHFQYDEVYVGTPEERRAKEMADKSEALHVDHGMRIPVHPAGDKTQMVWPDPTPEERENGSCRFVNGRIMCYSETSGRWQEWKDPRKGAGDVVKNYEDNTTTGGDTDSGHDVEHGTDGDDDGSIASLEAKVKQQEALIKSLRNSMSGNQG